jgi:hypothetical protein
MPEAPALTLTQAAVAAYRLRQQHLDRLAPKGSIVEAAARACGIQAQVASAAELALWARVEDLEPGEVADALWKRKTLVKTWAMRGTLHYLPAQDLPVYSAALTTFRMYPGHADAAWLAFHGLTQAQLDSITDSIPEILDGRCLTRRELAESLVAKVGEGVRKPLLSGWGAVLKPAARRGLLCFGPSQGQEVTFVRPDQWLEGGFRPMDRDPALLELLRRYLRTHGPATRQDFNRWAGLRQTPGTWSELAPELVTVDVGGRPALALADSIDALSQARLEHPVRLLANFDVYMLAHADRSYIVADGHKAKVYRTAGWVSQVVLVEGRAEAVWSHKRQSERLQVTVEPFAPLPKQVKEGVEEEAESLGRFLGAEPEVDFRTA